MFINNNTRFSTKSPLTNKFSFEDSDNIFHLPEHSVRRENTTQQYVSIVAANMNLLASTAMTISGDDNVRSQTCVYSLYRIRSHHISAPTRNILQHTHTAMGGKMNRDSTS